MESKVLLTTIILSITFCHSQKWKEPGNILRMPEPLYLASGVFYTVEAVKKEPMKVKNFYREAWKNAAQNYLWHNIHFLVVYEEKWVTPKIQPETLSNDESVRQAAGNFKTFVESITILDVTILTLVYDSLSQGFLLGLTWDNHLSTGCPMVVNLGHHTNNDVVLAGETLAHESGHCLNLDHSKDPKCIDSEGICIMYEALGARGDSYPNAFSAESINALLNKKQYVVTYELPTSQNIYATCGDGFVDPGEECDCGFKENCILLNQSDCCNHTTCKLKHSAQCSGGVCCEKCKFITGTVCRAKKDECDIEELCTGRSGRCPRDYGLPDGTPCANNTLFCSQSKCPSFVQKCSEIVNYHWQMGSDCMEYNQHYIDIYCKYGYLTDEWCATDKNICSFVVCESSSLASMDHSLGHSSGRFCAMEMRNTPTRVNRLTAGLKCGEGKGCFGEQCVNATLNAAKCANTTCPFHHSCYMGSCVRDGSRHTVCENVTCPSGQGCGIKGICVEEPNAQEPGVIVLDIILSLNMILGFLCFQVISILLCVISITVNEKFFIQTSKGN